LLAGKGDQLSGFSLSRGLGSIGLTLSGAAERLGGWPMLTIVVVTLVHWRKLRGAPTKAPLAALTFLLLTGLGGFLYVAGDLEGRMQLAAHVLLVACLLTAAAILPADRSLRWAVYGGLTTFTVAAAVVVWNPHSGTGGMNFNSPAWRNRGALASVKQASPNTDIYTNAQDGVWFATGRMTYPLPRTDGRSKPKPHPDRGGLVVFFKGLNRPGFVSPEFYNDRVLRDSTGKLLIENTNEAVVMVVERAQ